MIATSNTNYGPTYPQEYDDNYEPIWKEKVHAEYNDYGYKEYLYLPTEQDLFLEKKGAFFQWLWNEWLGHYYWSFCYWIQKIFSKCSSQVFENKPQIILAGYMSEDRGKHWRRYYRLKRY